MGHVLACPLLSDLERTVPTLDRPPQVRPIALRVRPAPIPDHPWLRRCNLISHMERPQQNCYLAALVLCASLFAGVSGANSAGSITPADPSPNDLIAAGQYQLAADALVRIIHQNYIPGQENQESAALLSNLGMVYEKLGRYVEAEAALEKSLRIFRDLDDTAGQNYARALNNLANVHLSQKRYGRATEMLKDTLAIYRNSLPDNTRDIALVLNNLGLASLSQQQYPQAERLFRESLDLQRRASDDSPELAVTLNNVALVCKLQNRLEEAAGLYSQAIDVWRNGAVRPRPEVAIGLHNLASLENVLGDNIKSENHFKEALVIIDASLPAEHPTRTFILTGYADLLLKVGRKREAKQLLGVVRTLRARHDHQNFQDLTVDVRNMAR